MIDFAWPWMSLLLLVPLLMWLRNRRQVHQNKDQKERQVTLLHPSLENLQAAFSAHQPAPPVSSRVYKLLLALLWIGLTLTVMRPQWLEPHTEERQEGYDLMLVVDASESMGALDFSVGGREVTRMQVIKGVMGRFIGGRENDRIGLIVFGDNAHVLTPLTLDLQSVRYLLSDLVPNIAGGNTAMGDALGLGVKKLRERPEGSRIMILIADGDNTAGTIPPKQAGMLAAREGIRIYAIGVGSNEPEIRVLKGGMIETRKDLEFEEDTMRHIAEVTGGSYFRATDTNALEEIYQRIDELEKSQVETRTVMIPHPLYRWPLALALAALLSLGLFPGARLRRFNREVKANA